MKHIVKTLIPVALLGIFLVVLSGWKSSAAPGPLGRAQSGAAIYSESCASCHGGDGRANTRRGKRKGAKDLTKSRLSRAMGIKIITHGRGEMPAFKDSLSKAEIRAVNEYVRSFR
ncbi:MAG TPA: c-type cytochrome [Aridibacter sp.]|nr:c-type cytochrome [Aridibacter sp.]